LLAALRGGVSAGPVALAEQASTVEMVDLSRMVGKQDHYLASLGGMRVLRIDRHGRVSPEAFAMSERFRRYVGERLLLFHTGLQRDASAVLARQDEQTRRSDQDTLGRLHAIQELAHTLLSALKDDRVEEIGPVLAEHWRYKSELSDAVAVPHAVQLLERAQAAGADGGKLLGAGGGGYLLLSCRPGRQAPVRHAMLAMGAVELPFGPSDIGVSSRLVPVDQAGPDRAELLASSGVDESAA
jgi:D-glycero-alpha-D-manno-heptose-7-phosphate kinase